MENFIRCQCEGDLKKLLKKGKAGDIVLKGHWRKIYVEYCDLTGDSDYKYMISCMSEMLLLQTKVKEFNMIISLLKQHYDEKLQEILRENGIPVRLNPNNPEDYEKTLAKCQNKIKTWQIRIKDLEHELARLQRTEGNEINYEYYAKILISLSRFMKYHIKADRITVAEYAMMIDQLRAEVELWKGKTKRNG